MMRVVIEIMIIRLLYANAHGDNNSELLSTLENNWGNSINAC